MEIARELKNEDGKESAKEWLLNLLKKRTASSVETPADLDIEEKEEQQQQEEEDEGVMVE